MRVAGVFRQVVSLCNHNSPPGTDRGTLFKINMSVRAIPPSEPRPY